VIKIERTSIGIARVVESNLRIFNRRSILSLIGFLACGGIIAYAIFSNWDQLREAHLELNYSYIILSFVIYPLAMLPTALAWHTLLRAISTKIGFQTNLKLYSLTCLFRNIPGFVWFIGSRTLLYQEQKVPLGVTAAATTIEMALLALTGFFISGIVPAALPIDRLGDFQVARFLPLVAAILLVALVVGLPSLERILRQVLRRDWVEQVPHLNQKEMAFTLLWMLVAWSGGGIVLWILARAITPVNWSLIPAFIGIWGISGAVSLTLGVLIQGMGLRELTLGALLGLVMPTPVAFVLAIAFRLLLTIGEPVWALVFVGIINLADSIKERAG
jgi:glycosyltransferase 2 family protein